MLITSELVEGIFMNEKKNRFLCDVLINGEVHECYVPSSSKMNNYLKLNNKKVLLTINKSKTSRTKYYLFAVKYYNKTILLNLNQVNSILLDYIVKEFSVNNNHFEIKKETFINGYKTDLLVESSLHKQKIIIECKGIIGTTREVLFPTVHSERSIKQLKAIKNLLNEGFEIRYYFISLSPIIKTVMINTDFQDYYKLLKECIESGLKIFSYSIRFSNNEISLKKIKLELQLY